MPGRAVLKLLTATAASAADIGLHVSLRSFALRHPHRVNSHPVRIYRVGKNSKLSILSEYVNKTQKIGGT